jgi:glycosyltransferase involved in cell wall biosynthesis
MMIMKIGFDAKRAFHNSTGLGNHARNLIQGLHQHFPMDEMFLFNPKANNSLFTSPKNVVEVNPTGFGKIFPSFWRSKGQINDIEYLKLDIYHGLSHELPIGIENLNVKKIVTIHDLIFEHFPNQYKRSDAIFYRKKIQYACKVADKIIAISEATKKDLINCYHVNENKIVVGSNVIHNRFFDKVDESQLAETTRVFKLPNKFFISVGSLIERKNVMAICEAFQRLDDTQTHLVIVGKGTQYAEKVKSFLRTKKLLHRTIFLEDVFPANLIENHLPMLYAAAVALIYPSQMEGFGMPVAEAMAVGCPVITSSQSSMLEVGDNAALLVNPNEVVAIENAMKLMLNDKDEREKYRQQGFKKSQQYTTMEASKFVNSQYKKLNER